MTEEHKKILRKLLKIAKASSSRDLEWYIMILIYYFAYYAKSLDEGEKKAKEMPEPFRDMGLQLLAEKTIEILNDAVQEQNLFDEFLRAVKTAFFGR